MDDPVKSGNAGRELVDDATMFSNPARFVYGTIVVGGLLAIEDVGNDTYPTVVGSAVVGLLLYWVAHSYAESAGRRLADPAPLTIASLLDAMKHEMWLLVGAAVPMLPLLLWWITGGALTNAVTAAVWTSAGTIVIVEIVAALRADLRGRDLVEQVIIGALLGILVIALKLFLH